MRQDSGVPRCSNCGHMIIKDSQNRWVRFIADLPGIYVPRWECHASGGNHLPRVKVPT